MTPKKGAKRRFCTFLDKSKCIALWLYVLCYWGYIRERDRLYVPYYWRFIGRVIRLMSYLIGGNAEECGGLCPFVLGVKTPFLINQNAPLILTWWPRSRGNVRFQGLLDKSKRLCLYLHDVQEGAKRRFCAFLDKSKYLCFYLHDAQEGAKRRFCTFLDKSKRSAFWLYVLCYWRQYSSFWGYVPCYWGKTCIYA